MQVTVILTCPGVDLRTLDGYGGPATAPPPQGFDVELSQLRARLTTGELRRLDESSRRRRQIVRNLEREGRWLEESATRRQLKERIPLPLSGDFPTVDPPTQEEGLEYLPLVFAGSAGPMALAARGESWELLELSPAGGVEKSLGSMMPPDRPPTLSEEAQRLLEGYLRYWLERDQLFGTVLLDMAGGRSGSVLDCIADELREIAAVAVSRGYVFAALRRGSVGLLSGDDLRQGIRSADQDLLDRPAWGTVL